MTRSRLGAGALLAATLLLGLVIGGTASTFADRRQHERRGHGERMGYVERLARDVELNPAQQDSVRALLERHRPVMDSLWDVVRPMFDSEREKIRNEIRALLTPQQLEKYNARIHRQDSRRNGPDRSRNEKR
ncbi:MAG: hypothetical protein ACRENB_16435 [Gemmatimonadales bacterium]